MPQLNELQTFDLANKIAGYCWGAGRCKTLSPLPKDALKPDPQSLLSRLSAESGLAFGVVDEQPISMSSSMDFPAGASIGRSRLVPASPFCDVERRRELSYLVEGGRQTLRAYEHEGVLRRFFSIPYTIELFHLGASTDDARARRLGCAEYDCVVVRNERSLLEGRIQQGIAFFAAAKGPEGSSGYFRWGLPGLPSEWLFNYE